MNPRALAAPRIASNTGFAAGTVSKIERSSETGSGAPRLEQEQFGVDLAAIGGRNPCRGPRQMEYTPQAAAAGLR